MILVKLEGLYLFWSPICDAPGSFGMTRAELVRHVRKEEGARGVELLKDRLARLDAKGTSVVDDKDADDSIWLNRAAEWLTGWTRDDPRPLSKAEIVRWYVQKKRKPTMAQIRAHRRTLPACVPCVADDGHGGGQLCVCWVTGVREAG